jgi:hypothetical protein
MITKLDAAEKLLTDDLDEKKCGELLKNEVARLGDPTKVRLSSRQELRKISSKRSRRCQNFLKHTDKDPECEMDDLSLQ